MGFTHLIDAINRLHYVFPRETGQTEIAVIVILKHGNLNSYTDEHRLKDTD